MIVFFLFSVAIGTTGYFFYESQKKSLRQKAWDQVGAIAELKVRQIVTWRKERIADARVVFENPLTSQFFQKLLENRRTPSPEQEFLGWISSLREHLELDSVLFLDKNGTVRFSVPQELGVVGPTEKTFALEAVQERQVVFSDFIGVK